MKFAVFLTLLLAIIVSFPTPTAPQPRSKPVSASIKGDAAMRLNTMNAFPMLTIVASLWTSAAADELKRVTANGTELGYVEAGEGDPVVFVHGGLQDYRMWKTHVAVFAKRYRVIAYSRRNHFPNEVSRESTPDVAADIHAEDLAGLVKALGLSRVHVVAHSAGAHAALFFAANHPDLVRTLVVNEPNATGLLKTAAGGAETIKEFVSRFAPARETFRSGDLERALRLFADAVGGPGTYDRRSEEERGMMRDNALAHVADATSSRPRPNFTCEMAQRITAPTLLLNGARSPAFFHRIVDELEHCLAKNERMTIPDASHNVPGENPQRYDEAVLAFLAKH